MAETVKVPVIGPTDKRWVYAGGALIAGIVGYAWWNRVRTGGALSGEILAEDIPQDREPPATIVGSEDFDTGEVRAIINTNDEWTSAVLERLVAAGYDSIFILTTLGKFLARRPLTEQEAQLVQAAKGIAGEPPLNGPWAITRTTASGPFPDPSGKLKTPSGLHVTKNRPGQFAFAWTPVAGANYYMVKRERPGPTATGPVRTTSKQGRTTQRNYIHSYRVQAVKLGRPSSDWSAPLTFRAA